ncbi:hypothetical protein CIB84_011227 [Bambusicola thoracicus]|uniref:PHF7/G2E3-like PHD zinc finger domain-containing protein n=1 Tax=Bambusicola thoracicus TaxID=9083 RepID=A0A2P4SLP4_BAMTH|nr:hypothetical protein CIB84_011227 [Bambusicola thoracicus]
MEESEKGNLLMERDLANSVSIKRFYAAYLSDTIKAVAPAQLWMRYLKSLSSPDLATEKSLLVVEADGGQIWTTVCVLCGWADVDPDICGGTFAKSGIRVREFCLIFATGIYDERTPWEGISRLPLRAIKCTAKHANQKHWAGPGTVPAGMAIVSPEGLASISWRSWEQARSGQAEMAWICLTLRVPGAHHLPSLLWQTTIMGNQCICIAARGTARVLHRYCDASECYYPGGKEQAEEEGPWKLLLCSSCAAQGTHWHCSFLTSNIDTWECKSCAGEGIGKRHSAYDTEMGAAEAWKWVLRTGLP